MIAGGQTICLNMIVKNEAPVIRRCLDSVRSLIGSWVIVDTGSTDGTQDIIRDHLRGIPGELYERPWVDFARNRSEALELARGRGDYVFVIDADEIVEMQPDFTMPVLTAEAYNLNVRYGGCTYLRKQLVRNSLEWRYEGVLHEYITSDQAGTEAFLPGLVTVPHHDGARARDPLTYRRDALMLEKALLEDPTNTRYVFYLAQSYRDAGDWEMALRNYKRRAAMGGWSEEVWFSLYQIAQLKEKLEASWGDVMEAYLAAHQFKPDRAGPFYRIGMHYQAKGEYNLSHLFLARAMAIPYPSTSSLFVEHTIYNYQLPLEFAVASFYAGDHATAIDVNNRLLRSGKLPPNAIDQVIRNRRFSLDALFPKQAGALNGAGRVVVLVPFRDAGPELDDCVDSLAAQTETAFEAVFLDDGSREPAAGRIPVNDPRFRLVRFDAPLGRDACIAQFAAGLGPTDIVLLLNSAQRLAAQTTLAEVRAAFDDAACHLAYAQNRTAAGGLGNAEPAVHERDFVLRGGALAGMSAVACRASLLREASLDCKRIWQRAGYGRTRFLDAVWTEAAMPAVMQAAAPAVIAGAPLVSCVMVTLDRLRLAKRSILSYAAQTYAERELVIVTDGTERFRRALERFVEAAGVPRVRILPVEGEGLTLGRLRNISIEAARGQLICQWDDDDCSHPERLAIQIGDMLRRNAGASFLSDHLQYLEEHRLLCWVDWSLGGTPGPQQLAPGTGVVFKDPRFRYPEDGPMARHGEDSVLLDQIYASVPVAHLSGMGHLYLYQFHGRNTFSRDHHYRLSTFRTSNAHVQEHAEVLRQAMKFYPVARPVMVSGKEGPLFAIA